MKYAPNTPYRGRLTTTAVFIFGLILSPIMAQASASDDTVDFANEDVLDEDSLSDSRGSGGTINITTVTSNQTMESTSTGNTLIVGGSLTNGSINVGDNMGGSGFGSYVMNSGNNSVINSGVSLSILMQQ